MNCPGFVFVLCQHISAIIPEIILLLLRNIEPRRQSLRVKTSLLFDRLVNYRIKICLKGLVAIIIICTVATSTIFLNDMCTFHDVWKCTESTWYTYMKKNTKKVNDVILLQLLQNVEL